MINEYSINSLGSYERIASEYYEPELHPTCHAFDVASYILMERLLKQTDIEEKVICDVGAGRSIVASVLREEVLNLKQLWLVDSSEEMLMFSDHFQYSNIYRRVMNSENIDHLSVSFDLVVSNLGDPYNTNGFWAAVASSLEPSGSCVFTTPSYEWAKTYREGVEEEFADQALFVLADGTKQYVPSYIYSKPAQAKMLARHGLEIFKEKEATVDCLDSIPSKLSNLDSDTPIVSMYQIRRMQHS